MKNLFAPNCIASHAGSSPHRTSTQFHMVEFSEIGKPEDSSTRSSEISASGIGARCSNSHSVEVMSTSHFIEQDHCRWSTVARCNCFYPLILTPEETQLIRSTTTLVVLKVASPLPRPRHVCPDLDRPLGYIRELLAALENVNIGVEKTVCESKLWELSTAVVLE